MDEFVNYSPNCKSITLITQVLLIQIINYKTDSFSCILKKPFSLIIIR
ncbi:hypothetical protein ABIB60_003866 [Hymenobacter sp. UYP22]